jgi:hypothetical protein
MKCDRCKTETTKTKEFDRKDGTGKFIKFVCIAGCKDTYNGNQYDHTFFPPKGSSAPAASSELKGILETLLRIEKILANPKQMHVAESKLQADEEAPF